MQTNQIFSLYEFSWTSEFEVLFSSKV